MKLRLFNRVISITISKNTESDNVERTRDNIIKDVSSKPFTVFYYTSPSSCITPMLSKIFNNDKDLIDWLFKESESVAHRSDSFRFPDEQNHSFSVPIPYDEIYIYCIRNSDGILFNNQNGYYISSHIKRISEECKRRYEILNICVK